VTGPGPRRLDPTELGPGGPAELDEALTTAAWLEGSMLDVPIRPGPDFAGRVMAALADEPTPGAAGFLVPLHRRGLVAGFLASVRQAWTAASTGGRPVAMRATALAYVLAVAVGGTALAGVATVGVGSALGIIGPSTTATPPPTPAPTDIAEPTGLPSPMTAPPEPSREPGESEGPDATDDHGGSSGPVPSDDHGGSDSSGPGSSGSDSDDHSGSSSGSDDSASATPRPTGTPRPTDTPEPTQTSGSGGDG
jgi:hypothetical protein